MNDFRHLFGGMAGGIAFLVLYIFCWGILQRCAGATVKEIAPDGVNEITIEVDENGYVKGSRSTCVHVPEMYIPQSGEKVTVGDFSFIMVAEADWTRWTNAVARLEAVAERRWTKEHKTDAGRREWHGPSTNRVVSADGRTVTWFYADGFTYTEEAAQGRREPQAVRRMKQTETRKAPVPKVPARLRMKQEAMAARPKVKEVNAIFSPGGKVLKVEESK